MHEAEFRLLDSIEDGHWWFVGKRFILQALLGRERRGGSFLDLGCGTGGVLRHVLQDRQCVGIDRSAVALGICKSKGVADLVQGNLDRLPFRPGAFETVAALDVIEHLDDDVAFLRAASRLCRPGGRMIIAVPAFQMLWSQHDETFEHRRRYSSTQLRAAIRAAGLVPERTTYTNCFVFPVAAVWRVLSRTLGLGRITPKHDFWPIPRWLNQLLITAYRLEAALLARVDLPVGVSVVCIARVPSPADERPHASDAE